MSAVAEETKIEELTPEAVKAFVEARNSGKAPEAKAEEKPEAKAAPKPEVKAAEPDEHAPRLPRSVRRELNRLREELGAAKALAQLAQQQPKPVAVEDDAEPQRANFQSDAEYLRATQKWDRAQAAKDASKGTEAQQRQAEYAAQLKAMDDKAAEDIKTLADWDEVSKKAQEDEDAPEFAPDDHPTLMAMLAQSDMKAFALYHFAKYPDQLQDMLDLTATPEKQIRAFHRLEGKLEKEYSGTKAAQATEAEKPKEDRKHLAEAARPGETAAAGHAAKPKPSSEVAARGGSPAPDEPAIGSAAWMLKRNQAQFGH